MFFQIIKIHILTNISKGKDNHKMKFDELIEYNMKNIFLERSCTKCRGEATPRLFSKNQN